MFLTTWDERHRRWENSDFLALSAKRWEGDTHSVRMTNDHQITK